RQGRPRLPAGPGQRRSVCGNEAVDENYLHPHRANLSVTAPRAELLPATEATKTGRLVHREREATASRHKALPDTPFFRAPAGLKPYLDNILAFGRIRSQA